MPSTKTRFAPSPTGFIHLGNARTALFSALYGRGHGGSFLLRIEDTDAERSRDEFVTALEEDLRWIGLEWQEGPGVGGPDAPYYQSQRGAIYAEHYQRLASDGHTYPCFCSEAELKLARKAQLNAGQPPRYSGRCARLSADERAARMAQGVPHTLRFRVPDARTIAFEDAVRGPQSYSGKDIGDFIIRRADGSAAFFFSNAVDDAQMGVTHVVRGEDHLTNTPRQLLILEALGLPAPTYAHASTITGPDGAPLSKRHGSRSLRELREAGYLPTAIQNYLGRLGHTYESDELLSLEQLAAGFDLARLGRAPARYDPHQLLHWQHQALAALSDDEVWRWMGVLVEGVVPADKRAEFIAAVRPNVSFPEHAFEWALRLFNDPLELDDAAREAVAEAGRDFFTAALAALDRHPDDFKAFSGAVKEATGVKGKALFHPLRLALTGHPGGPEMGRILPMLGYARARARLEAAR